MSRPATSRLKVNAPLGLRPSLENRRVAELRVDVAYQRSIDTAPSQTLIRKIAMFWDWSLFQPLVVARRADGSLWVVDGQHRLAAARQRNDMLDLPCVVTQYESAGDEAAAFVALNVQRRALSALDLFRAALAAEDQSSLAVLELIRSAGLSVAPHSNWTAWKPGMLSNISGIVRAHRIHGVAIVGRALRILGQAFRGQVLRYAGTLLPGIVSLAALRAAAGDREIVAALSAASQAEWQKRIELHKTTAGITRPAASFQVLRNALGPVAATAARPAPVPTAAAPRPAPPPPQTTIGELRDAA